MKKIIILICFFCVSINYAFAKNFTPVYFKQSYSFDNPYYGEYIEAESGVTFYAYIESLMENRDRRPYKVRIYGINLPEDSFYKQKAKEKLDSILTQYRYIILEIQNNDKYGRLIATTKATDKRENLHTGKMNSFVSRELVLSGLATVNRDFVSQRNELYYYEAIARKNKIGIWNSY